MAVAFRDAKTASINSTPITITKPTGTVDGDILIAVVAVSGASHLPSTPAGWTPLDNEQTGPTIQSYWKLASSEGANYSFTFTSGQSASGVIAAYSGGHQTTPINKHAAWHRSTSTTTLTADTVTTDVNGCMRVFVGCVNQVAATFTGPTSFTQEGVLGTFSVTVILADLIQSSAGATGSVTAAASASGTTQGSMICIAPPAAAVTFIPQIGIVLN